MMNCNDKCYNCDKEGFVGPTHFPGDNVVSSIIEYDNTYEIPKGLAALFLYCHELYCYPCYCVATSTCVHCGDVKDVLVRDKRCKNNLYLCPDCIKLACPHLFKCYSDGCMTPEEFAQQEFEMMQDGEGDWEITL